MANKPATGSVSGRAARLLCAAALLALGACASNSPPQSGSHFIESWKDPDAQPLQVRGAKVVAVVMMQDPKARRSAVTPKEGETQTRAAVESIGARGVVVMRPVDVNHRAVQTDTPSSNDMYGGYWGGYYGIGWSDPWVDKAPDVRNDLVATVETFVFSLPQNKLVWTGTSETINPTSAEKFIHQLAADATKELQRLGLIAP